MSSNAPVIAVIGLGEAGGAIATDLLAAGALVRGFDPAPRSAPDGVELVGDEASAAVGAQVVCSVNSAAVAERVAKAVAPALEPGQLFADLNTAAPDLKRALAGRIEASGAGFVDVALMGAVPTKGLGTPALASGSGADAFVAILAPLGMPVTSVGREAGEAAARKLVRSIFGKGIAAAIGESLEAAERLGLRESVYADIEQTLIDADAALMRRYVEGPRVHAGRRIEEMQAAAELLTELGIEPHIAAATREWLRSLHGRAGAGTTSS